jgi:hypothetical protein
MQLSAQLITQLLTHVHSAPYDAIAMHASFTAERVKMLAGRRLRCSVAGKSSRQQAWRKGWVSSVHLLNVKLLTMV